MKPVPVSTTAPADDPVVDERTIVDTALTNNAHALLVPMLTLSGLR
jgi:hypothetical protein